MKREFEPFNSTLYLNGTDKNINKTKSNYLEGFNTTSAYVLYVRVRACVLGTQTLLLFILCYIIWHSFPDAKNCK